MLFVFSWNPMAFDITLPLMAKGMIGIFVVISAIWGFAALLNKVTGKKSEE